MLPLLTGRRWSTLRGVAFLCLAAAGLQLLTIVGPAVGEIHRAKTTTLKNKIRHPDRFAPGTFLRRPDAFTDEIVVVRGEEDGGERQIFDDVDWVLDSLPWLPVGDDGEATKVWVYSVLASVLVGLTGILPLLIIPLKAGDALRKGGKVIY